MEPIYTFLEENKSQFRQPTVFEIGAADGIDTCKLYEFFVNPNYFAFEPDPRNVVSLKKNPVFKSIHFEQKAVGKVSAKTIFFQSYGKNGFGKEHTYSSSIKQPTLHLKAHPWCKFKSEIEVDVITLDNFCEDMNIFHIDFIWADIQGAEGDMIIGAEKILSNTRFLYLECPSYPLYDGQFTLENMLKLLGNKWVLLKRYPNDILLENKEYFNKRNPNHSQILE